MLPYTVFFLLVFAVADGILFGLLGVPLRGSLTMLLVAAVAFVLASQLIGALVVLLVRNISTALSLVAVLMAPAFGFMGIGFPREGMNLFSQLWGYLIPGTWFMQIRVDQTVRGTPWEVTVWPLLGLLVMVTLLAGVVILRLMVWRRCLMRSSATYRGIFRQYDCRAVGTGQPVLLVEYWMGLALIRRGTRALSKTLMFATNL